MNTVFTINLVEIHYDGARRARVTDPGTGASVWHGLGATGEPLRGYLGARCQEQTVMQKLSRGGRREVKVPDHDIELPSTLDLLVVVRVDRTGKRHAATVADLRAGDL